MPTPETHVDTSEFVRYYLGRLGPSQRLRIRKHVRDCRECRALRNRVRDESESPQLWTPDDYADALRRETGSREPVADRPAQDASEFIAAVERRSQKTWWQAGPALAAAAVIILSVSLWIALSRTVVSRKTPPVETSRVDQTLNDGTGKVLLRSDGEVDVTPVKPDLQWREKIREMLVDNSVLQRPDIAAALDRSRTRVVERGAPVAPSDDPVLISPFAEAVPDGRPVFRWRPVRNARAYEIFVRDAAERSVLHRNLANVIEFNWPADLPPLQSGARYSWQLAAYVGQSVKVSDWDSFSVLDQRDANEVALLENRFRGSPLALAAVHETFGLYTSAQHELEVLETRNPGDNKPKAMLEALARLRKK